MRNVTLRVRFTKGNSTVFDGVDWYWFTTGVSRAVRKGVASLQENWRSLKTLVPLDEMLKRIKAGPGRDASNVCLPRGAAQRPATPIV